LQDHVDIFRENLVGDKAAVNKRVGELVGCPPPFEELLQAGPENFPLRIGDDPLAQLVEIAIVDTLGQQAMVIERR
jgi:hypothetical protein